MDLDSSKSNSLDPAETSIVPGADLMALAQALRAAHSTSRELAVRYLVPIGNASAEAARSLQSTIDAVVALRSQAIASAELTARAVEQQEQALLAAYQRIREFSKRIAPQLEIFYELQRGTREWEDAQLPALEQLAPKGWLLSLYLVNRGAGDVVRSLQSKGIAQTEVALERFFTDDACRTILSDCFKYPAFGPWREHLELALAAHVRKEYLLAIPVWLLVFDGVAATSLPSSRRRRSSIFGQMGSRREKALLTALTSDQLWGTYMRALVTVLRVVGRSSAAGDSGSPLNRHDIMHGRQPAYGSRKHSVQCILMLEALSVGLARETAGVLPRSASRRLPLRQRRSSS